MGANKFLLPFERPVAEMFKRWGEGTLTLMLLIFAAFIVYVAMQKDHLVWKAILLAYIVLP